jgi:hypothetical protein
VTQVRTAVAAGAGVGVGALGALAALSASHSASLAFFLGAAALSVALFAFVASLWIDAAEPASHGRGAVLVVFLLSIALGLMLAVGGHGGHA